MTTSVAERDPNLTREGSLDPAEVWRGYLADAGVAAVLNHVLACGEAQELTLPGWPRGPEGKPRLHVESPADGTLLASMTLPARHGAGGKVAAVVQASMNEMGEQEIKIVDCTMLLADKRLFRRGFRCRVEGIGLLFDDVADAMIWVLSILGCCIASDPGHPPRHPRYLVSLLPCKGSERNRERVVDLLRHLWGINGRVA